MFNKYIDNYLDGIKNGKFIVGKDIKRVIKNVIIPKLTREDVIIKHDEIEDHITVTDKYFPDPLLPWECFVIALMHCYYDDGTFVWTNILAMTGRGAGKNGFVARLAFYYTSAKWGIAGYDVHIVANSEKQAITSHEEVYNVIDGNKLLKKAYRYNLEVIQNKKTKSKIQYFTSNVKTKDGGRPGMLVFDEIHQYENHDLMNVFESGLGKRPLTREIIITTNGYLRGGELDSQLENAELILNGEKPNSRVLPLLYRLDDSSEVDDFKMWNKANPSLAYFPHLRIEMERVYDEMQTNPAQFIEFMTKRMNRPAQDSFTSIATWDKIMATNQPIPDLDGYVCIGGVDYAEVNDFCAVGLLFKKDDKYIWIHHSFVCHLALKKENRKIKIDIPAMEKLGLCTIVNDDFIKEEYIINWFLDMSKRYRILDIKCDKYRKRLLVSKFKEARLPLNEVRVGRPTHTILDPLVTALFADERLIFGDDPLMRWYTNNLYRDIDGKGNVEYMKIEPKLRKTDGFSAFLHALNDEDKLPVRQANRRVRCLSI